MFILLSLFACLTPGNPCVSQNTPSWCVTAVDSGIPEGDADTDSDTDSDADADTDGDTDSHVDSGHDSSLMTDSNPDSAAIDTAVTVDPLDVDDDADGYTENMGDCDDADPNVSPVGTELNTVKDENCDGEPFITSSFVVLTGTATITANSLNVLDDASATFTDSAGSATTGSWVITADTSLTSTLADLGPSAVSWPTTGGLLGGTYESLTMLQTNTSDGTARCIGLTAAVTSGQTYVMALTTRNTANRTNEFCLYADSVEAGCVSQAMNTNETFGAVGSFVAITSTSDIQLCATDLQGGVDLTQIGVFPASVVP